MKKITHIIWLTGVVCFWSLATLATQTTPTPAQNTASSVHPQVISTLKIPVDSPAMIFSPGNWTGDSNRGGKTFRQTWNHGAYFRVSWTSSSAQPAAKITFDTSSLTPGTRPPVIAYKIDGVWKINVPCTNEINVEYISGAHQHDLMVTLLYSESKERWGSEGVSPANVLRVTGVWVDEGSQPIPASADSKWALIVGDSITEGVGGTALAGYSHLLGQALRTQGYDYGISACGWSGWIHKGNRPPGDVPGYYTITNARKDGVGQYDDALSRWNKIDGNGHSLLDAKGRISAYGQTGQEPALIVINYGTNDGSVDANDIQASMTQALAALRRGAPDAHIIIIIPFNQTQNKALKAGVAAHKKAHAEDSKVSVIDLGPDVKRFLDVKEGVFGGLHPNDRGYANFAAQIIPQVIMIINRDGK